MKQSAMRLRVLLLLLALEVSSRAAGGRWVRLRSPHFELYAEGSGAQGRVILGELEQFRNMFASQAAGRNVSPLPVRLYLFQSEASFQPFQIGPTSPGYFHSGTNHDFIAMTGSGRTAAHEYVHVVMHHAAQEVPLWFGEGMAEFYSTARFSGQRMLIGDPIASHLRTLQKEKLLDIRSLLSAGKNSTIYKDQNTIHLFYAQSWALAHMLNLSEKYRNGIGNFVTLTLSGEPDALRTAFGRTEDEIARDLRNYIAQPVLPQVALPVEPIGKLARAPAEPLSELDAALLLGDLYVATGKRREAAKFYRAIANAHPESAEAEAALGYLELQQAEESAAIRHFQRAVDLGSKNARVCLDLALLQREHGAKETEVMDLLRHAVEYDPGLYESHYSLGYVALQSGLPAEAAESFQRAAAIQPNRIQAWEYLALAHRENGAREAALDAAAQAVRLATNDAELARTQATLNLVTSKEKKSVVAAKPSAPRAAVARASIAGKLTQIDCLGASARLRIDDPTGRMFLLVRNPDTVALKNAGSVSFEFACGPMTPRPVVVEYVPVPNGAYGTTGEVRSIEFR